MEQGYSPQLPLAPCPSIHLTTEHTQGPFPTRPCGCSWQHHAKETAAPKLARLHCRAWHRAGGEGRSKSGGESCKGQQKVRQKPLGETPRLRMKRASGHVLLLNPLCRRAPWIQAPHSNTVQAGETQPCRVPSIICRVSAIHLQASQPLLCGAVPT